MSQTLSEGLTRFIDEYILSIDHLETLLLLQRHPNREWTAASVSAELRTSLQSVAANLELLKMQEIIRQSNETFSYAPKSPSLDQKIQELARVYPVYRIRITELIYLKPKTKIQSFANAFRLKKPGGENG